MKVLVACEFSGVVRNAFIAKGHDAWSCDILEALVPSPFHLCCDVLDVIDRDWDLIIAHPPCTYLCNSGVTWLHKQPERWALLRDAMRFFYKLLDADCPRICVENPIPHKYALLPKYSQVVQPWMFGHKEKKATCLWLKGLPKLVETNNVREETEKLPKHIQQRLHYMSPSKDRGLKRSITFKGLAEAMAEQWSDDD